MTIGVPRGLLYYKHPRFIRTFYETLGAEVIVSPETNKDIVDEGAGRCVDDACLPVKVFHGHAAWLRGRCDALFLPRLIGVKKREYICPMFCGLNEMIVNSVPGLPKIIDTPIYSMERARLARWAQQAGRPVTDNNKRIRAAFEEAGASFFDTEYKFNDMGYALTVGLFGHAYNLYDSFINMDVKKKLNDMGIGVITGENAVGETAAEETRRLFKKPFWTFAGDYYGSAAALRQSGTIGGIIYLSSFACGVDSVVTSLIKSRLGEFPFMILKLDEHTGQAGFNTRLEAFCDLLKRRREYGNHIPQYGQYRTSCGGAVSGA